MGTHAADAVGKRLQTPDWTTGEPTSMTVIGVARDIKYTRLNEEPHPYVYLPHSQAYSSTIAVHVRGPGGDPGLLERVRQRVHAADPNVAILESRMLIDQTNLSFAIYDVAARVLRVVGVAALALAALGIYGLVAYTVKRSAHEIGIRMTIGAARTHIVRGYVMNGVWLTRRSTLVMMAALLAMAGADAQSDPDALYRERATLPRAREAIDIWEARLKVDPRDFESAWKIARASYWLGKHEARDAGRKTLERGVAAGKYASTLQLQRPEGYFWGAANMGALAESYGLRQGLRYRGQIREALEQALELDPAYLDGSADRALGRWYHMVPGLFGGSETKSEEHLRKSLTYNSNSILSRFFLAETLFARDRSAEALDELRKVIAATPHREFEPEDREIQAKAAEELARRTKEKR